jgi:hypothetical protein
MLLGCVYTHIMIFYYFLRCRQAYIVATVSYPVSTVPAINYRWCPVVTGDKLLRVSLLLAINYRLCHCYRQKLIAGVMELMKI